jgi:hypothetical protein
MFCNTISVLIMIVHFEKIMRFYSIAMDGPNTVVRVT